MGNAANISQPRNSQLVKRSRTGCLTCRARHIKCDERRPVCKQCEKTHRPCDGYSGVFRVVEPRAGRTALETRCFEFFCRNTVLGLAGFDQQSSFWKGPVLQSSKSSPAVFHAVLALAAFHGHLDGPSGLQSKSYSLSLIKYNEAIKHIRSKHTSMSIPHILICCVLFICLENARRNHGAALKHLNNGLEIIRDWQSKLNVSTSEVSVMRNIIGVFRRLDIQATIFFNTRQLRTSIFEGPEPEIPASYQFGNLQDAQASLEEIEMRLFYILTTWTTFHCRAALLPAVGTCAQKWKDAFDSYVKPKYDKMSTHSVRLGVLLALHHDCVTLVTEFYTSNPANALALEFDAAREDRMLKIIDQSRCLLRTSSQQSSFKFSADTGVIVPLFIVTTMTANPETFRQAVDLLRSVECKEGFWDAKVIAKMTEGIWSAKHKGREDLPVLGSVPELAKAHCNLICS